MTVRYFHDDNNGEPVELFHIQGMPNKEFGERFPGVVGRRMDGCQKLTGVPAGTPVKVFGSLDGALPVTRAVQYKAYPSRHECNARCVNGKPNGTCECACGGKNHGRGGLFVGLREST